MSLSPIGKATSNPTNYLEGQNVDVSVDPVTGALKTHTVLVNSAGTEIGTLADPIRNQQVGTNDSRVVSVSGVVYEPVSGTTLTVKRAFSNVAASQVDAPLVAAVALRKLRVLSVYAVAGGTATTLTFNSKPGGGGVAISALMANGANGGEVLGRNQDGWFETSIGEGLSVTTGAGSSTGIGVNYVEVP